MSVRHHKRVQHGHHHCISGGCSFATAKLDHGWRSTRGQEPGHCPDPSRHPDRTLHRQEQRRQRSGTRHSQWPPPPSAHLTIGYFIMPETRFPIRVISRIPPSIPVLSLLLASVTLGRCSGGDFGRTRADFRNDDMHGWMGGEVTGSVGPLPSQFPLPDKERLLRDLAYPLIEPPHSRPAWRSVFGDYKPIASPWRQEAGFDRSAYGRVVIDEPHRSYASRYAQLMEDVRDDITRFEPFFADAVRVIDLDKKRNAALAHISELSPRERADAVARMQE